MTDITYIRIHEGRLYLAAVIDLYSRKVVGWSMASRIQTSLALNAVLMAVWLRKPTDTVIMHSDQGSQFTSHEWQEFLAGYDLEASMSRRSNCYDNAVEESSPVYAKPSRLDERHTALAKKHGRTCSITSKYSKIQNAGMLAM